MIYTIITAMALAVIFIANLELQRRKYRQLWIEESKRHAGARMELSQWIETAKVTGDYCAAHKSTIAKLKMEVIQLHEELELTRAMADGNIDHDA